MVLSQCATKPQIGNPLIVGFNWGASDFEFAPPVSIPEENFKYLNDNDQLGSLKRIVPFLIKYLPKIRIEDYNQSNYCMFRSYRESEISNKDIDLSEPIFVKFVNLIHPPFLIAFSSILRIKLEKKGRLYDKRESIPIIINSKGFTYKPLKARLKIGNIDLPIYFLPHPMARFSSNARNECWEFCFDNVDK